MLEDITIMANQSAGIRKHVPSPFSQNRNASDSALISPDVTLMNIHQIINPLRRCTLYACMGGNCLRHLPPSLVSCALACTCCFGRMCFPRKEQYTRVNLRPANKIWYKYERITPAETHSSAARRINRLQ